MTSTSDRVVEALARLTHYAESRPEPGRPRTPPLTIALTRQAGSGGAEIARAVGARLGWPVYDHELLTRIAEEKGLHERILERLDERPVSWLEDVLQHLSSAPSVSDSSYVRGLLNLLAALGEQGHCIIVGRGAAQVMPPESTLRVRVVAPRDFRVASIARSKGLSQAQAGHWVDQTDQERARFVRQHFHADVADPHGYDLILNSARFGVEACASILAEAARVMEARLAAAR